MAPTAHFSSTYYRGDLRVFVNCSLTRCGIDVAQPVEHSCAGYHLELLLQPTDEHGWPRGQVRVLYEAEVPMSDDGWSPWSRGYHRLPFRMSEDLLSRCHIRLTCNTVKETQ